MTQKEFDHCLALARKTNAQRPDHGNGALDSQLRSGISALVCGLKTEDPNGIFEGLAMLMETEKDLRANGKAFKPIKPLNLTEPELEELESPEVQKLLKKIANSYDLDKHHISRAVEIYYDAQKLRIMHRNKERSEDPRDITKWFALWLGIGEKVIENKLKAWMKSEHAPAEAKWAVGQMGIGPVLASGLAAYIDPERASTVSSLWKYSGYDPNNDRPVRGQKLAYNARLKTLCWKIGESFVKVSGKEEATYGQLYGKFKSQEVAKNETGKLAGAAKRELSTKKFKVEDSVTKVRLNSGMLSDAHLHARAKRKAVKIFLSHYWQRGREARGLEVRPPYPIQILGHDGMIEPKP